eukprot:4073727-Pleurochrysis_carterae.AAC.1
MERKEGSYQYYLVSPLEAPMSSNSDEQLEPEDDDPLFALCDEANDENDPLFDMPSLADQAVANLHAKAPVPRVDSATVRTGMNSSRIGIVTGVTDRRGSYQRSKAVDTCEGETQNAEEQETDRTCHWAPTGALPLR